MGYSLCKEYSITPLKEFCAKSPMKKHQRFNKWDHFEKWPFCKGNYCPCKIVELGQKLKFQKTCRNRFYNPIKVVLCQKTLEKTPNIQEMRPFWKSAILQSQMQMQMQNCRFGWKIKIPKNMQKSILQPRVRGSVQKTVEKIPNILEIRPC